MAKFYGAAKSHRHRSIGSSCTSGNERILYLAVSRPTFNSVFTIELGQVLLKNKIIRLIVFDQESEAIAQWIPN
ncbi:element excision factor XisH family protein [Coleofasciculus sp.]|uniref:element excision factor XisH family protein n=1 Tax=Coleofasciculus sp. TaxID=3100458 RepID=UPI003A328D60